MKREPWNQAFYDLYEWTFWVPSVFGRVPDPRIPKEKKGWPRVLAKLERTEEPINHILRFLFKLAPDEFAKRLTAIAFENPWRFECEVIGRDFNTRFELPVNSTQPDILFTGNDGLLSVEMKVGARTTPSQLAKYLFLHARAEMLQPRKQHGLIYLGPKTLEDIWQDRAEVSLGQRLLDLPDMIKSKHIKKQTDEDTQAMLGMAKRIELGFMNYAQLDRCLDDMSQECVGDTWQMEMARDLIAGGRAELAKRGYSHDN